MRALRTIHRLIRARIDFMHAKRWDALWRVTMALIEGKKLWLSALGRSLPVDTSAKHAIKAVDRLLGNAKLHAEKVLIQRALAEIILPRGVQPIVLVDTMEIRHRVWAFTAAVAFDGRAFPLCSQMVTAPRVRRATWRAFLEDLENTFFHGCRPILVTDGGFEGQWFDDVEAKGWDYVGRVRGQTKFKYADSWISRHALHRLAHKRSARDLGLVSFPKTRPCPRRLVLSKLPTSRHRQVITRTGPSRDGNYLHYRKNSFEPLVLVTSLPVRAKRIVGIYKTRMQIEQNFRDAKNYRWGWSLRHCGSRSKERIEMLLMIGHLAMLVQQLVGIAAEKEQLHRRHQANTIRKRRVLSVFLLGGLIINSRDHRLITASSTSEAFDIMRLGVRVLEGHS